VRSAAGRALLKRRGEMLERSFAHLYDRGGMRRVELRGRENIRKRLLIQAAAFNLSLILRQVLGAGTPRQAAALRRALLMGLLRAHFGLSVTLGAGGATRSPDPGCRPRCSHMHRGARR